MMEIVGKRGGIDLFEQYVVRLAQFITNKEMLKIMVGTYYVMQFESIYGIVHDKVYNKGLDLSKEWDEIRYFRNGFIHSAKEAEKQARDIWLPSIGDFIREWKRIKMFYS